MKNVLIHNFKILSAVWACFFVAQMSYGQTITAPSFDNGNTRVCQTSETNEYPVSAIFTGTASASDVFTLELSNVEGSTAEGDTTILQTANVDLVTGEINFSVLFPEGTAGENYRMIVRSPQHGNGQRSNPSFAAYVYDFSTYSVVERCIFLGNTLTADPADLESYVWYRQESSVSGNPQAVETTTSNTFEPEQTGFYFFAQDIGDCNNLIAASGVRNGAMVMPAEDDFEVMIDVVSGSTELCAEDGPVILTAEVPTPPTGVDANSLSYVWFKDDVELTDVVDEFFTVVGSEEQTLSVNGLGMEGNYRVGVSTGVINDDSCTSQAEETITLKNPKIEITSDLTVFLLAEGQTTTLSSEIIRGADPKIITWHRVDENGDVIEDLPQSNIENYEVSESGMYTVSLSAAATDCTENFVYANQIVNVVAPDSVSNIVIAVDDDYDDCVSNQAVLQVESVTVVFGATSQTIEDDELDDLTYEWRRDGVSIDQTGRSILIDSASDNGEYTAFLGGMESNSEEVILALNSFEVITSSEFLEEGGSVELSLGLENTTGYFFQWFRNNQEVTGETSETYVVNFPGVYFAEVTTVACGTEPTNSISINSGSPVIPNVITPNNDGSNDDWVLPSTYNNSEDIEINIYTSNGQLDYSGNNYQGNWPDESQSNAVGTIYYYIISGLDGTTEKGSITIIR